jgi:glutathione S-transferase
MTLTLCGFPLSNYYNKVKLILLEKDLPFIEEVVRTGRQDDAVLSASPLAKIPFIRTAHGSLCESEAIADYLEALAPTPALMPADPFAAAKVRELIAFTELHLELVARELYGEAFFGGQVSLETKERVQKKLERNIAGFARLAVFGPYLAGDSFTRADCAAWVSLPLVAMAAKAVYGRDLLADGGVDWKPFVRLIDQRPAAQRVAADRKVAQAAQAVRPVTGGPPT